MADADTPSGVRQFESGATRGLDDDKLDYEGFLSPVVLRQFAEYLHKHRQTAAGPRASDNWQKGIPKDAYIKSTFRHFMDLWLHHRGLDTAPDVTVEETLCAMMFNCMGYLHVILTEKQKGSKASEKPNAQQVY